jgi:hypothetical protein
LRFEGLEARSLLSISGLPDLPGMHLVDRNLDNLRGQVVYLDFDGAKSVDYNGPISVRNIDVPAFKAPSMLVGHEQTIITDVLATLATTFTNSGVVFTVKRPEVTTPYSTVYVGGDATPFASHGNLGGIAEKVDIGNRNATDNAIVFSDVLATSDPDAYLGNLSTLIAHETGHLLGYAHDGSSDVADPIGDVAAIAPDAARTFTHPAEDGSGDNVHNITLTGTGTYTFEVDADPNGYHRVDWYTTYSGGSPKETAYLYYYDDSDFTFSTGGTYSVRAEVYRSDLWNSTFEWEAVYRWNVNVNQAPSQPGSLSASNISRTGARVSWGPSTDPDGDSITYEVQYGKTDVIGDGWTSAGTTSSTSLNLTGLVSGTRYTVRVIAQDGRGGASAWREQSALFTTQTDYAPTQPGTLSASSITRTGATVSWGASTDANGDSITYEVQYGKTDVIGDGWKSVGTTSSTSLNLTGLASGTRYTVRVIARDTRGYESAWREQSALFTTQTDYAPTQPGTLSASSITRTGATVSWGASTDANGDSITYEVQYGKTDVIGDGWKSAGTTSSTSLNVSGLALATRYTVRVIARDARGYESAWREQSALFTTRANNAPTAPGAITVPLSDLNHTSARINWGASTDQEGDLVTYEVEYGINNTAGWTSAGTTTSTSMQLNGLTENKVYVVRVRALDSYGGLSGWNERDPAFRATAAPEIKTSKGMTATANPNAETWVVFHGLGGMSWSSADKIYSLANAVSDTITQVLVVDWSGLAAADSDGDGNTWLDFGGEQWITPVADWTTSILTSWGFVGTKALNLNFIGHSWGAVLEAEVASRMVGGINRMIALDPAEDAPPPAGTSYNTDLVNFSSANTYSWSFYSRDGDPWYGLGSNAGNETTSPTADESIVVVNSEHSEVVWLFTSMLTDPTGGVSGHFSLDRLRNGQDGPWKRNQYKDDATTGGPYEAVITAASGGTAPLSLVYISPATSQSVTVLESETWPKDVVLSNSSVPENQPTGSTVGLLTVTDPDVGNTVTYKLVSGTGSTDNASFTINGDTLKTASSFNYETKNSYSVRIRSTDQGGLYTEKAFAINVTNVNEQPTDIALSNGSLPENQPSGTTVGALSTVDPDSGNTFTYSLVSGTGSTDNASFTISGSTLQAAAAFNYESKNTYSIRVRSTDQGGLFTEKAFTINVTNVNEQPADTTLSSANVPENQPSGTAVGKFGTTDPDNGDIFTYSLVSGTGSTDNGSFTISGSTLKTAAIFDYEVKNVYNVRIRSTDQGGLYTEKAFTINVTNVNESLLATVTTPPSPQTGNVTISYTLADAESHPCSVQVEYSPNGGTDWYAVTKASSGGDGTTGLSSRPSGTSHTFVWASGSDIVNANNGSVKIRITPSDAGGAGTPGMTSAFSVNNSAGVQITQSGGSTNVTEGGATDSYTVVLTSQPSANVTITVTPSSQVSVDKTTVNFTPSNWNVVQTVTVTAVDDKIVEGNHIGSITHVVSSSDANYNNLVVSNLTVQVFENGPFDEGTSDFNGRATADFNGDGTADILWYNQSTGDVSLWIVKNGAYSSSISVGTSNLTTSRPIGIGDFNGDGTADILWQNPNDGLVSVWLIRNGAVSGTTTVATVDPANFRLVGIGDFNGDGTADILWQNRTNGNVGTWLMRNGTFSSWSYIANTSPVTFKPIGVGDVNGDGTADILWQNQVNGNISEWIVRGGTYSAWAFIGTADPATLTPIGVGDFNADRTADVVLKDKTNGNVSTWILRNGILGGTTSVAAVNPTNFKAAGVADFNGDGTSDILWQNKTNGNVGAWTVRGGVFSAWTFFNAIDPTVWTPVARRLTNGSFVRVDGERTEPADSHASVTQSDLESIVPAAIDRWLGSGLDESAAAQLRNVRFVIGNLPGTCLGETDGNVVYIDSDAAGRGWFADLTPAIDEEFIRLGAESGLKAIDPRAVDRIDLLTVLEHELGHVLGLNDLDASLDALMSAKLGTGIRRLPTGPVS